MVLYKSIAGGNLVLGFCDSLPVFEALRNAITLSDAAERHTIRV